MENALTPFLSSFFILLREGFEAMLIAALVFMYLDKVKARNKRPAVFWGIAAGIVDDGTARQPIWKWFPELNDEYDFVDYH